MPAQALLDVPFDPHLNFLFFGEELLHSVRLWTAGYNIYAPVQSFGCGCGCCSCYCCTAGAKQRKPAG
jgi:hypothetical protein